MTRMPLVEPVQSPRDLESIASALRSLLIWKAQVKGVKGMSLGDDVNHLGSDALALPQQVWEAIADLLGLMAQQQPILLVPLRAPDDEDSVVSNGAGGCDKTYPIDDHPDLNVPQIDAALVRELSLMARLMQSDLDHAKVTERILREFR